jgi:hypothetical protein
MSSVAFASATSSTSSTVMMPTSTPLLSTTGSATRSYFSKAATTSSREAVAGRATMCRVGMSLICCSGGASTMSERRTS